MSQTIAPHALLERRDAAIQLIQAETDAAALPRLRRQAAGLVGELFSADQWSSVEAIHFALLWRARDLTGVKD